MNPLLDLYSQAYLTAIGIPGNNRRADEEQRPEPGIEQPEPATILVRIKRRLARVAAGLRRFEVRPDQHGMADWWVGL